MKGGLLQPEAGGGVAEEWSAPEIQMISPCAVQQKGRRTVNAPVGISISAMVT